MDIALIYSEAFPGARYVESKEREGDDGRLVAFMGRYGGLPTAQAA
jgi:hypothetical protein